MVSMVKRGSLPMVSGNTKVIALGIGWQVPGATPAAPAKPDATSLPQITTSSWGIGVGSTSVTVMPNGAYISRVPWTSSFHAASPKGYAGKFTVPVTMLEMLLSELSVAPCVSVRPAAQRLR
ncbi:MAG: hypothetical protein IPN32_26040 [Deltaproteobacteria bacterium]|nr:hypothetical protein [Deltaproteobacteria bacterium]